MTLSDLQRAVISQCSDLDEVRGIRVTDDEIRIWITDEDNDAVREKVAQRLEAHEDVADALELHELTFILTAQDD
jgi:hypothetical protein